MSVLLTFWFIKCLLFIILSPWWKVSARLQLLFMISMLTLHWLVFYNITKVCLDKLMNIWMTSVSSLKNDRNLNASQTAGRVNKEQATPTRQQATPPDYWPTGHAFSPVGHAPCPIPAAEGQTEPEPPDVGFLLVLIRSGRRVLLGFPFGPGWFCRTKAVCLQVNLSDR